MRKYIVFNIIIQFLILNTCMHLYYAVDQVKLILSLFILYLIFVPSIIEYFYKIKLNRAFHYSLTIINLILFIILIVF